MSRNGNYIELMYLFLLLTNYLFLQQSSTNEIEETLKRIQSHKGVVGVVVINNEGESLWQLI